MTPDESIIQDLQQWRRDVANLRDLAIEAKNEKIEDACFDILMKHPLWPITDAPPR